MLVEARQDETHCGRDPLGSMSASSTHDNFGDCSKKVMVLTIAVVGDLLRPITVPQSALRGWCAGSGRGGERVLKGRGCWCCLEALYRWMRLVPWMLLADDDDDRELRINEVLVKKNAE